MRIKTFILTILILLISVNIHADDNAFKKLAEDKNITTVVVSKSLLSLSGFMGFGGANVKDVSDKFDQVEIYESEDKKSIKLMRQSINNLVKNENYEILMNIKDQEDTVIFYAKSTGDKTFKDLIMFVDEGSECTIIRMLGTFTPSDIQKIMNH